MPEKKYKYGIEIDVRTKTDSLKKGADETEQQLTRTQKQANRAIAFFEKYEKQIERAQKALEALNKISGLKFFTDFEKMIGGLSREVGKLKTGFDALKTSIEAAANAKRKFGNTTGTGGGGGSGGVSAIDNSKNGGGVSNKWTAEHQAIIKASSLLSNYQKQLAGLKTIGGVSGSGKSGGGKSLLDTERQKAAADISRMRQQSERAEKEITRAVEREARTQNQIRTREMRKSANDMIREINRVQAEESKTAKPRGGLDAIKNSTIGSFVGNLGAQAVSIVTSALVEGGKAVLDYSSKLEQTKIGFTTLLGSGEKANQLLKEIQEFAKSTPFEFEGIAALSQRLAGANVEATKIIPLMRDIGNVVAATGEASQERLEGVTVAITQIISKQKFSAEEAEQLAERGVNAFQILSEATGKSQADLRKMSEDGKISSDVFIKALQQISQQKFGDAMEKQSRTFNGAMSNIKDTLLITASTAFEPLYIKISEIADRTAKELEGADFGDAVGILANNIAKGFGEALGAELKREIENYSWQKLSSTVNFNYNLGSTIAESMWGDFNIADWVAAKLGSQLKGRDLAGQSILTREGGLLGALLTFDEDVFNENQRKLQAKVKTAAFDVNKTFKDGVDFNGAKVFLDPITNTLKQIKTEVKSTPNLAKQLDAQKAADDAKKLSKELNSIALDYSRQIVFFGQDTEVAAAKQQLLAKGVNDFSTGAAKAIIEMAGMLDKLKEQKKAQVEYNEKLKSAGEEISKIRDDAQFKIQFAEPTDLDNFNRLVKSGVGNFRELKDEIEATRDTLNSLALVSGVRKSIEENSKAFEELSGKINGLREKDINPLRTAAADLAKSLNLKGFVDVNGVDATADAFGQKVESFVTAYNTLLNTLGNGENSEAQKASDSLEKVTKSFKNFLSTFTFKAGESTLDVFGDKEELDKAVNLFLALGDAATMANKAAADKTYADMLSDLTDKINDVGNASEYNRVKKQFETEAYKKLNDEQRQNLLLKAQEADFKGLDRNLDADLGEALRGGKDLSKYEETLKLLADDYKHLSDAEKANLLDKAAQIDAVKQAQDAYDDLRDVVGDSINAFAEGGWQGLFDSIKDRFKSFLLDMATEWLTSKIFKTFFNGGGALNGSGQNQSGGGFLDSIKSLFGLGGRGVSATPNFNPNVIPPTGTINAADQFVVNGNQPDLRSVLGDLAPGLLPGTSGGGKSSTSGLFGKGGIFGEKGFGNNTGTYGVIGTGAALLGSLVGGRFGGLLSGAGTGLALGAQIGSIIPGIGTAIGAGVGAVVGGLIGLITGGTRKKDEKTRNQATLDAFSAIDKLIQQVNNDVDFTDAAGVISQGATIRQSYLDTANSLKDKKTRNIALKDVSRIDEKLRVLETLAKEKASKTKSRQESLLLDVPTFSDGGSVADFMSKNFQNNPLGYVQGAGSSRSDSINAFFPQAKTFARISNSEYVLDSETTKNIGIAQLDRLRANKGRNFDRLKYVKTPLAYADGGAIGSPVVVGQSNAPSSGSEQPPKVETHIYIQSNGNQTESVKSETYWTSPEGKRMLIDTVEEEIYRGGKDGKIYKAVNNVANGNR